MVCQTEIASTIIEQGADYVLALKANQGNLYEDVTQLFNRGASHLCIKHLCKGEVNKKVKKENHSDRHSDDEGLAVHCQNSNLRQQF